MLTADRLRNHIDTVIDCLLDLNLVADTNATVIRQDGGDHLITWASTRAGIPLYSTPTVEEYERLLVERQYNVLLSDFSMLQMSFWLRRGRLTRHRLCFYPCLVADDADLLREVGVIDYLDMLTADDCMRRIRLESPIRFDFDEAASRRGHAASHVTLSRDCCRIPVFGPLSAGHFLRAIFEQFYPDWWRDHKAIREWPMTWFPRSLADDERLGLHFEWRQRFLQRLVKVVSRQS